MCDLARSVLQQNLFPAICQQGLRVAIPAETVATARFLRFFGTCRKRQLPFFQVCLVSPCGEISDGLFNAPSAAVQHPPPVVLREKLFDVLASYKENL